MSSQHLHCNSHNSMNSSHRLVLWMILLARTVQISCNTLLRDGCVLERRDILSSPIISVLRKSNPRSVEILVHATSDATDFYPVCENILREFPGKILKFEDQTESEIPLRMRTHEDLMVLYLYQGYQCPNHDESREIVKKMSGFYWWFLRVKLLMATSTVVECNSLEYFFQAVWKYKVIFDFAITNTKNVVTYHEFDPYENSYRTTNNLDFTNIFQIDGILNMFGHRIRTSNVNDPPLTIIERDNDTGIVKKIGGLGHEIMTAVCKVLNATYSIIPRSNDKYGIWTNNGSSTGIIGEVITGIADINPRGIHMLDYGVRFDNLEFVDAIYYDEVWALVPKNHEQIVSHLDDLFVVLGIAGALIANVWLVAYLLRFESPMRDPMVIYGILMNSAFPRVPVTSSQRIFFYTWIVGTMILSTSFQTSLINSMSFRVIPVDIETLEELEASGRNVMMFGGIINVVYASANYEDSYIQRLHNRTIAGPYRRICAEKLLGPWYRNGSCTPGTYEANAHIHSMLKNGRQALVSTKESFLGSWQTFLAHRGTPWLPSMNKILLRLQESGLIQKWLADLMIDKQQPDPPLNFTPLTTDTFNLVLAMVTCGYFLSALCFGCEHVYFRCRKKSEKTQLNQRFYQTYKKHNTLDLE